MNIIVGFVDDGIVLLFKLNGFVVVWLLDVEFKMKFVVVGGCFFNCCMDKCVIIWMY